MKKLLLTLLCFVGSNVLASHIVGGEFEIQWLTANTYRVNLIYYFDVINNGFGGQAPEQNEPSITVAIFQKSNHGLMQTLVLPFVSRTAVSYTQPECSNGEIVTDKVVYSATIELPADTYNHPEGYYLSWQRCCRNYTITNIFSSPPGGSNISAGQTFYLEFPPVVKNGQPFINSSPRLFPPLNDYACPNKLYYADFAGTDDDGDSLVYTLVTPLSTHLAVAVPPAQAGPYPLIQWRPPYGFDNILNGSPDLKISTDGLLTVTPTEQGLFVFAVKCEEFRNKVKIGEVRRDFQMLVVDGCSPADHPEITGRVLTSVTYTSPLTISIPNTATGDDRCIEVKVTDMDIFRPEDGGIEKVTIRAIPLGFKGNVSRVLPTVKTAVLTQADPDATFKICFDECPFHPDGYFAIGVVAFDDACSLPLSDTLRVNVYLQPRPNRDPYFITSDVTQAVPEGTGTLTWDIIGVDDDKDPLEVTTMNNVNLEDFGMALGTVLLEKGRYEAQFSWTPDCEVYDFSSMDQFKVNILLNDKECDFNEPDTLTFDLSVLLPPNTPPDFTLTSGNTAVVLDENNAATMTIGAPIQLNLRSVDPDPPRHNQLEIEMIGAEGTVEPQGFTFNPVEGAGDISTMFSWQPGCEIFKNGKWENNYTFTFRTFNHSCHSPEADTISVDLTIKDIESKHSEFLPPNFVTPNNDGKNDWFGLDDIEMTPDREYIPKLPADNCAGHFLAIQIYNRWGKKVFESDKRTFRWYPGDNQSAGMYFYTLQYTNAEYKGTLTLSF